MKQQLTSQMIKDYAKSIGADLCGIASMDRFEGAPKQQDPRYIMPRAKACIVLAFRIPRGYFRGIEEGTFFGAYNGLGYGNINQVVSPLALRELCCYIEDYGHTLLTKMKNGETIPLPMNAKNLAAGLDWAENSGKLIANLLFKEECFGEAYTVSSGQNLTWGEVAKIYTELMGAKIEWVSLEEYLKATNNYNYYALLYDRLFDRQIDNSKILKATGLTKNDFLSVKEGLRIEINKIEQELNKL